MLVTHLDGVLDAMSENDGWILGAEGEEVEGDLGELQAFWGVTFEEGEDGSG